MTFLLIRFALVAALIAVVAVVLFAIAVRLKRRGRWDETRRKVAPLLHQATRNRGGWKAGAIRYAADRLDNERHR